jgi:hypothetical protein
VVPEPDQDESVPPLTVADADAKVVDASLKVAVIVAV